MSSFSVDDVFSLVALIALLVVVGNVFSSMRRTRLSFL
jgi:hypothetical protein